MSYIPLDRIFIIRRSYIFNSYVILVAEGALETDTVSVSV